jgi:hypothetical protein
VQKPEGITNEKKLRFQGRTSVNELKGYFSVVSFLNVSLSVDAFPMPTLMNQNKNSFPLTLQSNPHHLLLQVKTIHYNNTNNNNNSIIIMVKLLALAVVRTGNELPDPIVCSFSTELSSFGFFQRPVSAIDTEHEMTGQDRTAHA